MSIGLATSHPRTASRPRPTPLRGVVTRACDGRDCQNRATFRVQTSLRPTRALCTLCAVIAARRAGAATLIAID